MEMVGEQELSKSKIENALDNSDTHREERLAFISKFSNDLLKCDKLEEIYKMVTETTREKLCCRTSSIFLFTKDGKLRREYISGFENPSEELYERGQGLTGRTAGDPDHFGKPHIQNDIAAEPSMQDDPLVSQNVRNYEETLRSEYGFEEKAKHMITIPLNGIRRTFAVLRIVNNLNPKTNRLAKFGFTVIDQDWLLTIANLASMAVANIKKQAKYDAYIAVNNLLSQETKEEIFDSIAKIITGKSTRYEACVIRISDERRMQLFVVGSSGRSKRNLNQSINIGEGVVGETFLTGNHFVIKHLVGTKKRYSHDWKINHKYKSMICIPLQNIKRTINVGTLSIYTSFKYIFDDIDIESLKNFSFQISNVLHNVQERKELELINKITEAINRENTIDAIFRIVVSQIPTLIGFDGCHIIRVNQALSYGEIVTSSNKQNVGNSFPLTILLARQVLQDKNVIRVLDVQNDPRFDDIREVVTNVKSMVIIPINSNSEQILYGAIILFSLVKSNNNGKTDKAIDKNNLTLSNLIIEQNENLYNTIANHLAIAIEKKDLITFRHNEFDRRDSIKNIVKNISPNKDEFKQSLSLVLKEIIQNINAEVGYIAIFSNSSKFVVPSCYYGLKDNNIPEMNIEGDGIVGWVYENMLVYTWPGGDIDNKYKPYLNYSNEIKSEKVIPLIYGNVVIGIIQFSSSLVNAFSTSDEFYLESFADELAIIITNRKLYLAALRLSEVRFDEMNKESICKVLAKTTCEIMGSPVTRVWLRNYEDGSEFLEMKAWQGVSLTRSSNFNMTRSQGGVTWGTINKTEEQAKLSLDSDQDHSASYYSLINNINAPDIDFEHPDFVSDNRLQSMISMPLIVQQEVIGTINTFGRRKHGFSEKEIHLLKNLAISGSIALKNAQLTEQAKKINEKILDSAQISNPGMVALSFTHDATHTLHYINALLSSLVELVPKNTRESAEGENVIRSITHYSEQLDNLFGSLIRYSKSKDINYRHEKLKELIEDVIDLYEIRFSSNKIKCSLIFESKQFKNVSIECDRNQIEQVFINLFNNAIFAIRQKRPRGPKIEIYIRDLKGESVEILFKDNGIGIFKENLSMVFEPLFTTKGIEGSGFGLAICKRIIEDNHLGRIRVNSNIGQSTTFIIKLLNKIF